MKKFVFVACAVMIAVMAQATLVAAQTDGAAAEATQAISSADFGVARIGILPTSSFYFLKELQRNIQRVFAFSAASKAKLEMKITNEKAAEIAKMQEEGVTKDKVIERALEGYEKAQERVNKALEKVKTSAESAVRDEVLMRATDQNEKHKEFLEGLIRTFGDKGRMKEIILKAEERVRGIAEVSLDKAAEEIDLAQELLAEAEGMLEEKTVSQEEATTTDASLDQPQRLLVQAQEYLDRAMAAFDEEKYGEAYGQARAAVATAMNAKRTLEAGEEVSSSEGEDGEEGSEAATDKNERKEGCICAQVYSPVCTANGKTYGNPCEAKCADEDVVYAGECKAGTVSENKEKTEKKTVEIENFAFSPKEVTMKKGTTITWVNKDAVPHQIASNPHPTHTSFPELASGVLAQGQSYSFTFQKTGTIEYHCHLHPSMRGKIVVVD